MIAGSYNQSNPVLSIAGADIIYYGNDLADYLSHEFRVPRPVWAADAPLRIDPWDTLVKMNDG